MATARADRLLITPSTYVDRLYRVKTVDRKRVEATVNQTSPNPRGACHFPASINPGRLQPGRRAHLATPQPGIVLGPLRRAAGGLAAAVQGRRIHQLGRAPRLHPSRGGHGVAGGRAPAGRRDPRHQRGVHPPRTVLGRRRRTRRLRGQGDVPGVHRGQRRGAA